MATTRRTDTAFWLRSTTLFGVMSNSVPKGHRGELTITRGKSGELYLHDIFDDVRDG
jgi:hypothetical protein